MLLRFVQKGVMETIITRILMMSVFLMIIKMSLYCCFKWGIAKLFVAFIEFLGFSFKFSPIVDYSQLLSQMARKLVR